MEKTFNIGDRVGLTNERFHPEEAVQVGSVSDKTEHGKLLIKWDSHYYNQTDKTYSADQLIPEKDALERWTKLDTEWKELEDAVSSKLTEAAKAIGEAAALAGAKNKNIRQMYEATYPLMNALKTAGWSTSSMSC